MDPGELIFIGFCSLAAINALFFAVLHEDDLGPSSLTASLQVMLELAAAYCLGEIEISPQRT